SPEQEPPKSLLLSIGVMTLGSSSFAEEDFIVAFVMRGRIQNLLATIRDIVTRTHHICEDMLANVFTPFAKV
ncbi:hypothetical protein A2U01_0092498, partial [Trifolium medium]|nr:hypothetical protein [Trifolium medium]